MRFTRAAAGARATTRPPSWTSGRSGSTSWRRGGDVYAYFNNEAEGDFARANARGLKERLGA